MGTLLLTLVLARNDDFIEEEKHTIPDIWESSSISHEFPRYFLFPWRPYGETGLQKPLIHGNVIHENKWTKNRSKGERVDFSLRNYRERIVNDEETVRIPVLILGFVL